MLEKLKLLATLLPLLIEMIRIVEQVIPGAGKGEQKLVLVRMMLQAVWNGANDLSANWPWIAAIISTLVNTFNRHGWEPAPLPTPQYVAPPPDYVGPNLDGT